MTVSTQVLTRSNDRNGTPYRLILVYVDSVTLACIELRDSRFGYDLEEILTQVFPDVDYFLGMPTFNLTPSEYNSVKKCYKTLQNFIDGTKGNEHIVNVLVKLLIDFDNYMAGKVQ